MNRERRATVTVCLELIKECADRGEMSESAYSALESTLRLIRGQEYWSLRNQKPHEGKNPSTDRQIGISEAVLPELESAHEALLAEEWEDVISRLEKVLEAS